MPLVPPYIKKLKKYKPGKSIQLAKAESGDKKYIKLASNENPLGASPLAIEAIKKTYAELNRYPDASGNPYLTYAAMLMAGIDGIKNKIHPGESFDKDLYELPPEEVKSIPTVCGSLREAMESLDKDREFLTQGGVFTDDQIDAYIALKFEEIHKFEHAPHPVEFEMYYSC